MTPINVECRATAWNAHGDQRQCWNGRSSRQGPEASAIAHNQVAHLFLARVREMSEKLANRWQEG
jgi:hypothetical protein